MKKHILLVAFVILGFSVVNAQYTTYTSANQCSGTTNAPALPLSFTSGTDDSTIDITLTFGVTGDFGADFETFTIIGEDGTVFGPFNRQNSDNTAYGDCGATPMNFSITIPQALWNIWNNDGTVNMTFQANTDVNFCDDRACISSVEALACPNCPIITNTSPNQCSGTTNAPALPMTFNSSTNDALSDVTLDFGVTGDFGADFETFTIIGEDGTVFGPFNRQNSDNTAYEDCGATPMNFSITIPQALWNIWNNDGTVNMTFQANTDVNFCDDRACISSIEANYLGAFCANDFDFVATTICQLGDEANFFVELQVNSLGSENTAFTVAIGGVQPNITMTGVYTYGPFPSGTPLDLILMGVDEPLCMFVESGLDKDCSCPPSTVDAGMDATICEGENTNISATLAFTDPTFYLVDAMASACPAVTPNGAVNTLSLGDDSGSGAIPIGFAFPFFNINYTNIYVSSNGYVTFSSTDQIDLSEDPIPNPTDPDAIIALFWDDLNPNTSGTISTFNTLFNGQTCFVIDYNNVAHFGGGDFVTGQIIICPDGQITINCIDCQVDGGTDNATQGIENEDGSAGYFDPASSNGQFNSDLTNCVTFKPFSCTFNSWITDLSDLVGSQVSTNQNITVSPTTTTTYYAVADCGGVMCADPVVVTVNPLPDLSVTSPITNTCPALTADITNTTATGLTDANSTTGTLSYHTVATPANASDQTVGTPTAVGAGTYYIRKETSAGCVDIVPIVVNFVTCCDITLNSLTPTNESCFQQNDGSISVAVTCNSCAATTDIRYSISPDPNSVNPQTSNNFTALPPGNYTITVFDVNDTACDDTGNTTINAASEIMVVASSNSPVCEGSNINLMATFTPNGTSTSAASWLWSGASGFTSSMEDPTAFASNSGNDGTYTVVVTDNNGCTNDATVNIIVDAPALVDLSSVTTDLCYKGTENIDLSGDYISGATNAGTWSTSGNGTFSAASNAHPTVTNYATSLSDRSAATVTLTLTADPGNACPIVSDNTTITIKDVSCTDTNPFDGNN